MIGEESQKVGSEDANEIVCALPDVLFDSFVFQDLYDIEYDVVYELSDGLGKIVVVIRAVEVGQSWTADELTNDFGEVQESDQFDLVRWTHLLAHNFRKSIDCSIAHLSSGALGVADSLLTRHFQEGCDHSLVDDQVDVRPADPAPNGPEAHLHEIQVCLPPLCEYFLPG